MHINRLHYMYVYVYTYILSFNRITNIDPVLHEKTVVKLSNFPKVM